MPAAGRSVLPLKTARPTAPRRALVLVDLQNDFCPGGALVVPRADEIFPVVRRLVDRASRASWPIVATRDWHPADHCSFNSRGGPWPAHCVAGSRGAAFASGLGLPPQTVVVSKATAPDRDAYSGFDGTELAERLAVLGVRELIVCGLATDYCVKATALDGLGLGFAVTVIEDAIRGVELAPGDSSRALAEMQSAGARLMSERDVGF